MPYPTAFAGAAEPEDSKLVLGDYTNQLLS